MYHQLEEQVPESVYAQTFIVKNYLVFRLDHKNVAVSSNREVEFPFQLIQPPLVSGAQLMEPYYLASGGAQFATYAAPV